MRCLCGPADSIESEFFTLKELEKLGPKLKGVISQSVKEVVEDLVSDGLVCAEKMSASPRISLKEADELSGTSNCSLHHARPVLRLMRADFWSFPSAAGAAKTAALDKAKKEVKDVSAKMEETKKGIAAAHKGREDTVSDPVLLPFDPSDCC